MRITESLTASPHVAGCFLAISPAAAEPFFGSEEIERPERQIQRRATTDNIVGFTSLRNYFSDAVSRPSLAQTLITDGF